MTPAMLSWLTPGRTQSGLYSVSSAGQNLEFCALERPVTTGWAESMASLKLSCRPETQLSQA